MHSPSRTSPEEQVLLSAAHVSRETEDQLRIYEAMLRKWNLKINLVSPASLKTLWPRHFLDSAQLWPLVDEDARIAIDFGSGAGFPALVLALIARERHHAIHYHLVEADTRKAAFLNAVSRELDLSTTIHSLRLEAAKLPAADLVTARAFAPLAQLVCSTSRLRKPMGQGLFPKGRSAHKELDEARRLWNFQYRLHPSLTHPQAAVVEIGAIHGAP